MRVHPSGPRPVLAYKWKVLATVIFGIFMVILDTTVVNVAFQTLRQEFRSTLTDAQWIISVYVLALGISTPLAGFLADRFGIKRVYLGGLAVFIFGSLLSGLAPSLWWLIGARALQGLGGGVALPLGVALLFNTFPAEEQGTALGVFGIAALVAPAVGPILGGWLVDRHLWRFIFFINPPIGLAGILLGMRLLHEQRAARRPALDILGLVTEVVGFGSVLYAASIAADRGWTSPSVLIWFGVGAVGLAAFAVVELFVAREPLLDLRLYGRRLFLIGSLLGYVSTVALFGAEFLMPVYLQALRGRSALETGLTLLPMAISGGLMVTLAGRIYDRTGPRPLLVAGYGVLLVNTWQLSQIQADTPIRWIMVLLALRGVALGLTVQTTMVTALSVVPLPRVARGSSLSNSTRQVVQSIGVAVLATVLASGISPDVRQLQQQYGNQPPGSAGRSALCTAPSVAAANTGLRPALLADAPAPQAGGPTGDPLPPGIGEMLRRACQENVAGFERTYRLTFYAALVAMALGILLPGWPGKWAGRRAADGTPPAAH